MKNIKIRQTIGKDGANYFISITDLLRQSKVVKVDLKNITFYFQIIEVFKSVSVFDNMREVKMTGSKNNWATRK